MKKVPFIKRLIVLTLCVGMVLGGNVSTLATEVAETQTSEEKVYTYEDSEISVEATAESDVLPSDAKLEVTPITEGTAYEEVEAQLESDASENDYEVAGFLAYDIRFVDQDGNEIEPEGSVAVSMEYKSAAIPEGLENAAEASVSVMHLEESDDAVAVKDLTADSTVNTTEDNAVDSVEFVTESFSTFSLVWTSNSSKFVITACYVNEYGNEINGTQTSTVEFKKGSTITFSDYAGEISGYSYQKTMLDSVYGGTEVQTMKAERQNGTRTLSFYNGESTLVKTVTEQEYTTQYVNLYLVYKDVSNQIETLDTKDVIDINVFDYKANVPGNVSEAIGTLGNYGEGYGINKNHYLKFMNSATGGSPVQNKYEAGYGATQGIVANKLGSDGYPQLASWGNGESLKYLYDENDIADAKKCYLNANYLFVKDEEGYYQYDSASNFATLAGCTGENNFTVYNGAMSDGGFFPLTSFEKAHSSNTNNVGDTLGSDEVNHYFAMTVETDFVQPQSGKINDKDMVFEFSGDDDVWVFIDDVLVLDIGGIHGTVSGSINFATGQVYIDKVAKNEYTTTIKDMFEAAGVSTEDFVGNTFDDFSTHTMKFYYMERGNQQSNCKLKFNLQTIPKGSLFVSKNATETEADDTSDYEFVVKDANGTALANAAYTLNTDSTVRYTDANGKFSLKSGEYAVFANLTSGNYSVTETGVSNSKYNYVLKQFSTKVSVNGAVQTIYNADSTEARTATGTVNDAVSTRFEFKNILNKTTVTDVNSELSKVIKYNEDEDDYDLTLSFKGPEETVTTTVTDTTVVTEKAKLDIVIVFDNSASMKDNNRLATAKTAASTLIDSITSNTNIDSKWKLITFADDAVVKSGDEWIDAKPVKEKVNAIECDSGTNYQAGLVAAGNEIKTARADAQKIVIFLTDGQPTYHLCKEHSGWYHDWYGHCDDGKYYLSNDGEPCLGGGGYTNYTDYEGALMGATAIECDAMYSVGINLVSNVYNNMSGLTVLTNVTNNSKAQKKSTVNKDVSELVSEFSKIAEQIKEDVEIRTVTTTYYSSNVTITDKLSQYVDIVEGSTFQISVKDQDGNEVGTPEAGKLGEKNASYKIDDQTLTASYNNKTVVLDFPDNYELNKGYTYSVTFKVVASEEAYEEYAQTGYPHTGEEGTDAADNDPITSSGKDGFRSNDNAEVTYVFREAKVTETYKHPVVQVRDRYSWELVKASASNNDLKLEGAEFRLYNDAATFYGVSGSDGVVAWYSDNTYANDKLVDSIPDGTYSLKETKAPNGYTVDTTEWNITVSKAMGLTVNTANGKYDATTDLIKTQNGKDFTQTLIFEDEVVYTLPETGGCGILLYTFTGMLMMMGGALYLFLVRRKSYRVK